MLQSGQSSAEGYSCEIWTVSETSPQQHDLSTSSCPLQSLQSCVSSNYRSVDFSVWGAYQRKHWSICSSNDLRHGRISSVQFSRSVMSDSLWPHGLQHARPPCPLPIPGVYSNSCPLSQWCHPTISSCHPLLPAFNLSQHQGLFRWVSSSHQVAKVLEFQLQHQSFQWMLRPDIL